MKYEFNITLEELETTKAFRQDSYPFEVQMIAQGIADLSFWTDDDGDECCECSIDCMNLATEVYYNGEKVDALSTVQQNAGSLGNGTKFYRKLEGEIIAEYYQELHDKRNKEAQEMEPVRIMKTTIYEQVEAA